jgi:hypothetical protein
VFFAATEVRRPKGAESLDDFGGLARAKEEGGPSDDVPSGMLATPMSAYQNESERLR